MDKAEWVRVVLLLIIFIFFGIGFAWVGAGWQTWGLCFIIAALLTIAALKLEKDNSHD